MDLKRLSDKAKDLVEKRGGTEALKQDAEQLRGIAKGPGTFSDKAKAAVSAIKDPGTREPGATAAEGASGPERERAESKVDGEARGKHAGGGNGARKGRGRRRREETGGDVGAL